VRHTKRTSNTSAVASNAGVARYWRLLHQLTIKT
jgi:hypothetical protein